MQYREFSPDKSIAKYIDAYWTAKGGLTAPVVEKILPDGCVDLIINVGDDCRTDDGKFLMQSEKVYFVGTMTRAKDTIMNSGTHLFGIRFKPGAFSAFFKFNSLHELTNQTIEFDKSFCFDLKKINKQAVEYLNAHFNQRLNKENQLLLQIITTIKLHRGQIKVDALALLHYTTVRQLERCFKKYIGIGPKDFINLVRYQCAMTAIQNKKPGESLLSIAFECGYYDHAHLTNELKRYTGVVPSLL